MTVGHFWDSRPDAPPADELKGRLGAARMRFAYGENHVLEVGECFTFGGWPNDRRLVTGGHARLLPQGHQPLTCKACKSGRPFADSDSLTMHQRREHAPKEKKQ